ncbi:cyclopropane-fatty-acyl-phospholipid synthase family protein [Actinomadura sp. WMMB 499]|uniref:SAM-dependent methyltransferase n=1 Tax=Actinomadura sp. WMMB 499 TaxID=1219491 RepID=UPI00159D2D8E|nr:cyclopropane-fatty-acyl-phospholipid synthase family protein [Actinomadura sp. WMMB 499]
MTHPDVRDLHDTVLGPGATHACGYWTSDAPGYGPADAQRDQLDLVCRKLDLGPGARFLDVGCGRGALVLHAAERYGARATGVTDSGGEHAFVRARSAERGLGDAVDVRLCDVPLCDVPPCDVRDVGGAPYDAVSSVETGERVGPDRYPDYCAALHRALRPGGRLLLQQLSSGPSGAHPRTSAAPYRPPGTTVYPLPVMLGHLEAAGFEIRDVVSLREHYVATIDAWRTALDAAWPEVVARFGPERARMWRLRLAGGSLAFASGRTSVHQVLAVRPGPGGRSGFRPLGDPSGRTWTAGA